LIYVIATLSLKPGAGPKLLDAAKACIEKTRAEQGCLGYDLHTSITDPHTMVFVEKWERREDLTAHSKQPHLAAWREASGPYLVSRRIEIVHPDKVETF
jgi:quinol monooxygenase YgiN